MNQNARWNSEENKIYEEIHLNKTNDDSYRLYKVNFTILSLFVYQLQFIAYTLIRSKLQENVWVGIAGFTLSQ